MIVISLKKDTYIQIGDDIKIAIDKKRVYIKASPDINVKRVADNDNNIFRFRNNGQRSRISRNSDKLLRDDKRDNRGNC